MLTKCHASSQVIGEAPAAPRGETHDGSIFLSFLIFTHLEHRLHYSCYHDFPEVWAIVWAAGIMFLNDERFGSARKRFRHQLFGPQTLFV